MSLIIEGNSDSVLNKFPLLLNTDFISSIGIAWLFLEDGKWCFVPRITGNTSLFYNAIFFIRLSFPFGIFASVRWSSSSDRRALFQCGIGWKLNGRITVTMRIQSDKTSEEGVTGPNYGQAKGFNYGTH